jgi:phosphoesterase RecJ-like protein
MSSLPSIKAALDRAQRVLVVSHVNPDGDTIGSALALAWALRARGSDVRLACADPVPALLHFLPGVEAFANRPLGDEHVVVAVDCSDRGRMGPAFESDLPPQVPLINIDHHVTNTQFGAYNDVGETAATAELMRDLIAFLGIPLDARMATCLLTGIITDTRCFRTHNTTPAALSAALELVKAGAVLTDVTDAIYNHLPLAILRLWGPALAQVQQADGIVWTQITQAMLRTAELGPEASDGLVNYLSTFHESTVAVVFQEQEDGRVDVSLRSTPAVNVAVVARALGGGGHPQASGAMLPGPLDAVRERVLDMLRAAALR